MRAALAQRMVLSGEGLSAGTVQWGNREGSPPAVRLTDRDLRLMALLYDVNFLSASQLLMLGWGDSGERVGAEAAQATTRRRIPRSLSPDPGKRDRRVELPTQLSRLVGADRARHAHRADGAYTPTAITSISYTEHDLQLAALVLRIAAGSRARARWRTYRPDAVHVEGTAQRAN